jgi:putative transposase
MYERLYREDIVDVLDLASHVEELRIEFNTIRPHEALSWNRSREVHLASPTRLSPPLNRPKSCHFLDAGHCSASKFLAGRL